MPEGDQTNMYWLVNSAVLPAGSYGSWTYQESDWEELKTLLKKNPIESRIGYAQTAQLIEQMTGVNPPLSREPSEMKEGDIALVVRLKYRVAPNKKGQPINANPEDWEVGMLTYSTKQ